MSELTTYPPDLKGILTRFLDKYRTGEDPRVDSLRTELEPWIMNSAPGSQATIKAVNAIKAFSAPQPAKRGKHVTETQLELSHLMRKLIVEVINSPTKPLLFPTGVDGETVSGPTLCSIATNALPSMTPEDALLRMMVFQHLPYKQDSPLFSCPGVMRLLNVYQRIRKEQVPSTANTLEEHQISHEGRSAQGNDKTTIEEVNPKDTLSEAKKKDSNKKLEAEWAAVLSDAVECRIYENDGRDLENRFHPLREANVHLSVSAELPPWSKEGNPLQNNTYSVTKLITTKGSHSPGFIYLWFPLDQNKQKLGNEKKLVETGSIDEKPNKRVCQQTSDEVNKVDAMANHVMQMTRCDGYEQKSDSFESQRPIWLPVNRKVPAACTHILDSEGKDNDEEQNEDEVIICRHSLNPLAIQQGELEDFKFETMGYVDSCFKHKYGAPRQGAVVPTSRASIVLRHDLHSDAMLGLEQYSHVWLVFVFNSNSQKKYLPKIKPPRLGGEKTGWLSTRSPHRWNDIGLSVVKLEKVEVASRRTGLFKCGVSGIEGCGRLLLSGVDLVDGTPILDIKPYHPSDMVPFDILRIPNWLASLPLASLSVEFSSGALLQLQSIFKRNASPLQFYDTLEDVKTAIEQVLSMDPRPNCTKRRHSEGIYGFVFDRLNVVYRMKNPKTAEVELVQYRGSISTSGSTTTNQPTYEKMNKQEWLECVKEEIQSLKQAESRAKVLCHD